MIYWDNKVSAMQTIIGYKKTRAKFRRKVRDIYTPIFKELGKGSPSARFKQGEVRRET